MSKQDPVLFFISATMFTFIAGLFIILAKTNHYRSTSMLQTTCEILSKDTNEKYKPPGCCFIRCSGCTRCHGDYPTCSSMKDQALEGYCCNGRYCCNYSDNVCTKRISNRLCTVVCENEYQPIVNGRFTPNPIDENPINVMPDGFVYYDESENVFCSEESLDADEFLSEFPDLGNVTCYYLPNRPTFNPVYAPIKIHYILIVIAIVSACFAILSIGFGFYFERYERS